MVSSMLRFTISKSRKYIWVICQLFNEIKAWRRKNDTICGLFGRRNYKWRSSEFTWSIGSQASGEPTLATNACEYFYSHFNSSFYTTHPNIFIFIEKLKEIQIEIYIKINSINEPFIFLFKLLHSLVIWSFGLLIPYDMRWREISNVGQKRKWNWGTWKWSCRAFGQDITQFTNLDKKQMSLYLCLLTRESKLKEACIE
jgi:hypothetical protein